MHLQEVSRIDYQRDRVYVSGWQELGEGATWSNCCGDGVSFWGCENVLEVVVVVA